MTVASTDIDTLLSAHDEPAKFSVPSSRCLPVDRGLKLPVNVQALCAPFAVPSVANVIVETGATPAPLFHVRATSLMAIGVSYVAL